MSECNNNCSSCSEGSCPSRKSESMLQPLNELSKVKKVIGVVSGKGGVGKSTVTALLASMCAQQGHRVAVLDADITGPSIPKAFGVKEKAYAAAENLLLPAKTAGGIQIMSVNLVLEDETKPVIWRGPILAGVVKQFWGETYWNDVDYMFVDMPPGTGDVPLTVFQSIPLNGIVIVTTPQDLVSMIVEKAVNMAKIMNIPIVALVENMSYYVCPHCGEQLYPFGKSKLEETAKKVGVDCAVRLPVDAAVTAAFDEGQAENVQRPELSPVLEKIEKL